jgi:hypothetical protein
MRRDDDTTETLGAHDHEGRRGVCDATAAEGLVVGANGYRGDASELVRVRHSFAVADEVNAGQGGQSGSVSGHSSFRKTNLSGW